jgi:uncharacterized membrane protein
METTPSSLDRPASIPLLRRLLAADALHVGEVRRMEERLRRELPWRLWLDRGLLILGVILIVAGIGYFFAHNWQHLTDDDKLVLAGGSVLIAFIASLFAGVDRFVGKLLLLAAGMLVGVFIAVFGQVYQTGADTYELFQAWALLILPWVVLGRFVPLWLFWLVLINLTVGFYWPVSLDLLFGSQSAESCFRHETVSLFLLNLAALALREWAGWAKISWLDLQWSAWILLAAVLTSATTETTYEIGRTWGNDASSWIAPCVVIGHVALILAVAFYFGRLRPSLPALALGTLSACWVMTVLAARMVFDNASDVSGRWLLMGILILAIFGGGVFLLRWVSRVISPTLTS